MNQHETPPADDRDQAARDARALGRQRLAARRRRTRNIRRTVSAVSVSTFLALTGVIGAQLASGQDPALSASASKTTTSTVNATTTSSPATTTTSTTTGSASSANTPSSKSSGTTTTPSAVTTKQS